MPRIERTGRDQLIVSRDVFQQLFVSDVVVFNTQRIDDDLQDLVAIAGDVGLQDAGKPLQFIAEMAGELQQRAFGNVSGQRDDEHGEQAGVDFVHDGFVRILGQFALGDIHVFPDVLKGGIGVEPGFELEQHRGVTFTGVGAHLLDALDGLQLLLHGPYQEPLRVLRGDALVGHRDVDNGDIDVGVRFLGNGDVRDGPGDQDQYERQKYRARVM